MKKSTQIRLMSVMVFVVTLSAAFFYYRQSKTYAHTIENNYARALYELAESVGEIDLALAKGVLVTQAPQFSRLSSEIWRQTAAAQTALGQLPISESKLQTTERFLSQVGAYAYTLSQKGISGQEITDEERQQLLTLSEYAESLKDALLALEGEWEDGNLSFDIGVAYAGDTSVSYISELDNLESGFSDYPTLIYDGPFSDHLEQAEAKFLSGKKEIDDLAALERFSAIVGNERCTDPAVTGVTESKLSAFSLSAANGTITGALTQKGGYPVWFLDTRNLETPTLSEEEAIRKAVAFLDKVGFTSMTESYYIKEGKSITVNFAYQQDGVTVYSDLIKVKVALDNGDIIGFEAQGYLMSHHPREIPAALVSPEEAQAAISNVVTVKTTKMALIPTADGRELPCYEILGQCGKRDFLMYVNTQTGTEENILMLLKTENGVLTL